MEAPLPAAPKKSSGALPWLLLGCGVFVLLGMIVGAGLGAFLLVRRATGTEIASAPAAVGQESLVTFTVAEAVPHALWLQYDVAFVGRDFRLEGTVAVRSAASVIVQDTLTLGPDGPPTAGGYGRIEVDARQVSVGGQGTASARVKLVDIPAHPAGTVLTGAVSVSPLAGTQVDGLRLVVTR
jgi:hypothetical protein